jgi:transposase
MARPYSQDLRERAVAMVRRGMSRSAVAKLLGLSPSCVVKWVQRREATGSVAAKPMGGRRPLALAGERVFVLRRIEEKPDLTISALTAELAERGMKVSRFAVWHFLDHEGLTFKKNAARQRAR